MKKIFILLFCLLGIIKGNAAIIYLNVPSLYNTDASSYKPNDTLWFIGQNPSQVYLYGLQGAGGNHIVVTADPGIVIGGGTSRNMQFVRCNYVTLYNLNVNGHGNNKLGIQTQFSSNFRYININIDSVSIGLQHKSNPNYGCSTCTPPTPGDSTTWYPQYKMYNASFYNVHIKNTNNEGFYIGHTYSAPDGNDPARPPAPLLGLSMEYCSSKNAGWDGVQVTGAWNIYMDSITTFNTGITLDAGQSQGVTIQDNTQGVFQRMRVDSAAAAGLNINSIGRNLYKNIGIGVASWFPKSFVIFVENKTNHGITLPTAIPQSRTLNMQDVTIDNLPYTMSYALKSQNTLGTGLVAPTQGKTVRFNFTSSDYTSGNGVSDAVPNIYIGGTIGIPDTNPTTRDSIVWYKSFRKDTWKIVTTTNVAIEPLDPIFLYGENQSGQVHLHWDTTKSNGGSSLTGYKVYRSLDSSTFTLLTTVAPAVQDWYDVNVTENASYFYKVLAYTSVGNSAGINCIKWKFNEPPAPPTPTVPDPPTNLSAASGNGFVTLTWAAGNNGNSPITHYNIYRGTSSGNTTFLNEIGTTPTYTDNTVVNETTYYYTVTAENVIGESIKSTEVTAKPTQFTIPSAPQNFTGTASPGTVINLSWTAPANTGGSTITNYKLYRGTVNNGSKNLIKTFSGTTFSFSGASGTAGTTYYYTLTAVNAIGEGASAPQITITALP